MIHGGLITESRLDEWVRGNTRVAQSVIPELVSRLVAVSSPRPKVRRFPIGDSIGQPGWDGFLDTEIGFEPFIPKGKSCWEIGAGHEPRNKAAADYKKRTEHTPKTIRNESVFVFVTPLSAARVWPHEAQTKWRKKHVVKKEWKDILVIDGTVLVDWINNFPAVESWLAKEMGHDARSIESIEQRWLLLRDIGKPHPLIPQLFTVNREKACERLKEVFDGSIRRLQLDTHFPDQIPNFVAAYVAGTPENERLEIFGRAVIVSSSKAWEDIVDLKQPHVIVADQRMRLEENAGMLLLEKAMRANHAVIYAGAQGGFHNPMRVDVPRPKVDQIQKALEDAGYKGELARSLSQKCEGNLGSLLRFLQGASLLPEWAEDNAASELVIAQLIGSWNEANDADRKAVEEIAGKAYGEWIETIREASARPGTPLTQRDGIWKFVSRFEGWYALGTRIHNDHLDRFRKVAISVLREKDPKFELEPEQRMAAAIYRKVTEHSAQLRKSVAETLALLGSHAKAASSSKAESTAVLAIREILSGADWELWASLNDLLPLLAEAAPDEFLDAVERELASSPCLFEEIFAQEGDGFWSGNYMTGTLWALETLAWEPGLLTRVIVILGELALRDPGGKTANRPANSIATILLPWLPQTCASISQRKQAIETLLQEVPEIGWKVLLDLLPRGHGVSSHTRRPAWREIIPDDWTEGVTNGEYWEQVAAYADLAIELCKKDVSKLSELIEQMDHLPLQSVQQLLSLLSSDSITGLSGQDRLPLWEELMEIVTKHRKYADAEWAMDSQRVSEIADVAGRLTPVAPSQLHRRLFSERGSDLHTEKRNYQEQEKELENRRQAAVTDVLEEGGIDGLLRFANSVDSPWRLGLSTGPISDDSIDQVLLPTLLDTQEKSLEEFVWSYVLGKFYARGWAWPDSIDISGWTMTQKSQFLVYLPFTSETWRRATLWLGANESLYWSKTTVNPYQVDKGLEVAVARLTEHGRPYAAIRCLDRMRHDRQAIDSKLAIYVLVAGTESSEKINSMVAHETGEIIEMIQNDPSTDQDELQRVEWAYLPILTGHHLGSAKTLQRRLAADPDFFCEVIHAIFRSKHDKEEGEAPTEKERQIAKYAYQLLMQWSIVPGLQNDGTFDDTEFKRWVDTVKATCSESGHFEVAMSRIGEVLINTPKDPNGLWIHRSVADVLNAKDAKEMRDGYSIAIFNSRGVFSPSKGEEERKLAETYRKRADEIESAQYHRLATALRKVAESYERDAQREATKDPYED